MTFTGFEPFWMRVAVEGLMKRYARELDCRWIQWPSTWRERLRFVTTLLRSDAVIRLGMPFEFQSETNQLFLVLLRVVPGLVGVNYWIGSDVTAMEDRMATGSITARDSRAIAALRHLAGTAHLGERLRRIGVPAVDAKLIGPERDIPDTPPPLPDRFQVLVYWSDGRFEFSGGPEVMAAAAGMSDVPFHIIGATGAECANVPSNVTFHGRVDDVLPLIEQCVVYVRLVTTDAIPSSLVEEVLLMGRYVIYSQEWPFTTHVQRGDAEALASALRSLQARHAEGRLETNMQGRSFTLGDSDSDARAAAMRAGIAGALRKRPRTPLQK